MLPAKKLGEKSIKEIEYDAYNKLKMLNIDHLATKRASKVSGGEKQRIAIARALIDRPEILLADEPTGNVDPPMALRLLSLFKELNRLGTAVLIATHDLNLMEQVEARHMILSEGHIDIYDR